VVNGAKYYLQTEFSNYAYTTFGLGKGCAQSEALAQPQAAAAPPSTAKVVNVFVDRTPIALPADGKTTSMIEVTASDRNANGVSGDKVHISVGLQSGSGVCGKLNKTDGTTDACGTVTVTYTASTSKVSCSVYAVEANGGNSAQAVMDQGTAQKNAATITDNFPTNLKAGAESTFTVTATNPSPKPVLNAPLDFAVFPGAGTTQSVDDSQIKMSYSTNGPNGPFTDVGLSGSTANGNVIDAYLGNQRGAPIAPGATETWTFDVNLDSVPTSNSTPLIAFEAYLDQINTASGSGGTLADTYATDIRLTPSSSGGLSTGWYVLIVVGGAVILAIVGIVLWRRHKGHPQTPTTEAMS
jgi:hypothetical protein